MNVCLVHLIRYVLGASSGSTVAGSTSDPGPWSYQLSSPTAITMDSYGYIYIMDYSNSRVQKWWPGAPYGVTVASSTIGNAYGLAMDPLGNLYVADTSNARVLKFSLLCGKCCVLLIYVERIYQRA